MKLWLPTRGWMGKFPGQKTKINNDLKHKNLRPQTKHKMTKLVSSHVVMYSPSRGLKAALAVASDSESECDSVDHAPAAPDDEIDVRRNEGNGSQTCRER